MARSWRPPPQAGAGWVHVRPLRQPPAPGEQATGTGPATPLTSRRFPHSRSSAAACPRQARSSSPAPRRAPRLRALQLDPGPRAGTNPAAASKATTTASIPPPDGAEVTGPDQHARLTTGVPMGAAMLSPSGPCARYAPGNPGTGQERAWSAAFVDNGRQAVAVTADRCSSPYPQLNGGEVHTCRARLSSPRFWRLRCGLLELLSCGVTAAAPDVDGWTRTRCTGLPVSWTGARCDWAFSGVDWLPGRLAALDADAAEGHVGEVDAEADGVGLG